MVMSAPVSSWIALITLPFGPMTSPTFRIGSPIVVIFGAVMVMLAQLTTNMAANVVSPANNFSNLSPRRISYVTGGLITAVIGILMMPWKLYADAAAYIFTWLIGYSSRMGALAGVLIADYWLVRRTVIRLGDLYRPSGIYRYISGWNWRAVVALVIGMIMAVGGAYSARAADGSATGPFPEGGLLPFLKFELPWGGFMYDYSWVVGLLVSLLVYWALATFIPEPEQVEAEAPAAAPEAV